MAVGVDTPAGQAVTDGLLLAGGGLGAWAALGTACPVWGLYRVPLGAFAAVGDPLYA